MECLLFCDSNISHHYLLVWMWGGGGGFGLLCSPPGFELPGWFWSYPGVPMVCGRVHCPAPGPGFSSVQGGALGTIGGWFWVGPGEEGGPGFPIPGWG